MYTFYVICIENMKRTYHSCGIAILLSCVLFQISCSISPNNNNDECNLGDYESVTFHIDPSDITSPLEIGQYQVDSVRSLITPDSLGVFEATKFFVNNEKIYILDTKVAKTILVFDISGKYMYKLGERGRAKNEYIDAPRDFFVAKNGDVHVFDVYGQKILIFDNNGKFTKKIDTPGVHSFGLTSNGKYVYFLDKMDMPDQDSEPSLMIYESETDRKKPLIPSKHFQCYYQPNFRTFFYNDARLSHIPLLSDSVIVFNNDITEKVVRFNFECGFLPKDKPEYVRFASDGSRPSNFGAFVKDYHGVLSMMDYQETDSLVLMDYNYMFRRRSWLYDKRTQKAVHGNKIFSGYCASYNYFLKGNQVIAYVAKENVEALNEYINGEEFDEKDFNKSSAQVRALKSGKISVPALFYISIKRI